MHIKKLKLALIIIAVICLVPVYVVFILKPGALKIKLVNALPDGGLIAPIAEVLKEKKIKWTIVKNDTYDMLFFTPYGDIKPQKNDRALKIFYTGEAYRPEVDLYDLSIGFDYIRHPKYVRLPYAYVRGPYLRAGRLPCNPHKEFACFLVSNAQKTNNTHNGKPLDGIRARNKAFHALSLYKEVKSGGKFLNNIGYVIPFGQTMEFLSNCKFVIAYENQSYPGYLTEKVFNAYHAGAVPIYCGHKSVLKEINKDAIIYAGDFSEVKALVDYIKKVDNDDNLYCKIYNHKLLLDDKQPDFMFNNVKQKFCKLLEQKLGYKNLKCNYA